MHTSLVTATSCGLAAHALSAHGDPSARTASVRSFEFLATASACYGVLQVPVPNALEGPFKDGCYLLQHDRSPIPTASTLTTVLENFAVSTVPWPSIGTDIDAIENGWGIMNSRLSVRQFSGTTSDTHYRAVSEECERLRLSPEVVVSLYE
ncbi:hypothetical protein HPB49_007920 [Dermacentor silvarum]|uniref:Uncharacterized protein n=1 Tax=Dermacentor silvarum TaxID=543639 RepID=A0ACB8C2L9_DERSI|nr:hypothetical protein HPB49_007920 [Dermacentor silvarum]